MNYKDMFKNYNGKIPHKEIDWGEDVGKERFWENESQALNEEMVEHNEILKGLTINEQNKSIDVLEGEMSRQPLNPMLRDFSYRTVVKIVDAMNGEKLFKGTVNKYHDSELKNKELYIEVAEVFGGEFVIEVR